MSTLLPVRRVRAKGSPTPGESGCGKVALDSAGGARDLVLRVTADPRRSMMARFRGNAVTSEGMSQAGRPGSHSWEARVVSDRGYSRSSRT